jgi:hypothetical protein
VVRQAIFYQPVGDIDCRGAVTIIGIAEFDGEFAIEVKVMEALQSRPACSVNPCSLEIIEVMVEAYEIFGAFQSPREFIYFLLYYLFHWPLFRRKT